MGSRFAKRLVSDRFGWVPGMASMSSLCGDAVLFAGVRSNPIWGSSPIQTCGAPVRCELANQLVSVDTSALCDPTMSDWKNFGGDIEVGVIVDEREIMLGR